MQSHYCDEISRTHRSFPHSFEKERRVVVRDSENVFQWSFFNIVVYRVFQIYLYFIIQKKTLGEVVVVICSPAPCVCVCVPSGGGLILIYLLRGQQQSLDITWR